MSSSVAAVYVDFKSDFKNFNLDPLSKAMKKAAEVVTKVSNSIKNGLSKAGSWAAQTAKDGFINLSKWVGSTFVNGIKSAFNKIKQIIKVSFTAVAAGITAILTTAVKNFAENQSLSIGIQTLFGKKGLKTLRSYSQEMAELGMSESQVMKSTSFLGAGLIRAFSGNGTKAMKASIQATKDMADNIAVMGSNAEDVENAYRGFAKNNFLMLDNLKLGYMGTQGEMKRLLEDAGKISGKVYDITNLADMTEAVHIIQQSMGITGKAAEIASKTLSGSFNAAKSSWTNLTVALAGGGNAGKEIKSFIKWIGKTITNVIPIIENVLDGIGDLLDDADFQDKVEELLAGIVSKLPKFIDSIFTILGGLFTKLSNMMPALTIQILTYIYQLGARIWASLESVFSNKEKNTSMLNTILQILGNIIKKVIQKLPKIVENAMKGFSSSLVWIINNVLGPLVDELPNIVKGLIDGLTEDNNLKKIMESVGSLVYKIAMAIPDVLYNIVDAVPKIIETFFSFFDTPEKIKQMEDSIMAIVDKIIHVASRVVEVFAEAVLQVLLNIPALIQLVTNIAGRIAAKALGGGFLEDWIEEGLENGTLDTNDVTLPNTGSNYKVPTDDVKKYDNTPDDSTFRSSSVIIQDVDGQLIGTMRTVAKDQINKKILV